MRDVVGRNVHFAAVGVAHGERTVFATFARRDDTQTPRGAHKHHVIDNGER